MKHIVIDGSVLADKRQGLVNKFQQEAEYRVALLSIKAAGVGITLTVRHVEEMLPSALPQEGGFHAPLV